VTVCLSIEIDGFKVASGISSVVVAPSSGDEGFSGCGFGGKPPEGEAIVAVGVVGNVAAVDVVTAVRCGGVAP
jgi:hypothetical protein